MKAQRIRAFAQKLSGSHGFLWRLDRNQDPQHGPQPITVITTFDNSQSIGRLGIRHACKAGFWFIGRSTIRNAKR